MSDILAGYLELLAKKVRLKRAFSEIQGSSAGPVTRSMPDSPYLKKLHAVPSMSSLHQSPSVYCHMAGFSTTFIDERRLPKAQSSRTDKCVGPFAQQKASASIGGSILEFPLSRNSVMSGLCTIILFRIDLISGSRSVNWSCQGAFATVRSWSSHRPACRNSSTIIDF